MSDTVIDNVPDFSIEERVRQISEMKDPFNTERPAALKKLIDEEVSKRVGQVNTHDRGDGLD